MPKSIANNIMYTAALTYPIMPIIPMVMGNKWRYLMNISSAIKTTAQHTTETRNKLAPNHAASIPTRRAAPPAIGDWVAVKIAGKVITAKVT